MATKPKPKKPKKKRLVGKDVKYSGMKMIFGAAIDPAFARRWQRDPYGHERVTPQEDARYAAAVQAAIRTLKARPSFSTCERLETTANKIEERNLRHKTRDLVEDRCWKKVR